MIRALWLANAKPPKQYGVNGEDATIIAIKNETLLSRLVPDAPDMMTVRAAMDWAELVRRVTTGYGANTVLVDSSLALDPLLFTLQKVLRPYRVSLHVIS